MEECWLLGESCRARARIPLEWENRLNFSPLKRKCICFIKATGLGYSSSNRGIFLRITHRDRKSFIQGLDQNYEGADI